MCVGRADDMAHGTNMCVIGRLLTMDMMAMVRCRMGMIFGPGQVRMMAGVWQVRVRRIITNREMETMAGMSIVTGLSAALCH